jgi:hypothetical protein
MDSQGQEGAFNMDACWECDKIWISHIETDAESHCKPKTERRLQADMWKF